MMGHVLHALVVPALLLVACGNSGGASGAPPAGTMPKSRGEAIFDTHCTLCHGSDGRLGIGGAKDLTATPLTRDEMVAIVTHGRGTMMPYKNILKPDEIEAVVDHVRTLGTSE
jgi:cytochrome c6